MKNNTNNRERAKQIVNNINLTASNTLFIIENALDEAEKRGQEFFIPTMIRLSAEEEEKAIQCFKNTLGNFIVKTPFVPNEGDIRTAARRYATEEYDHPYDIDEAAGDFQTGANWVIERLKKG